jgi:hypothetical protein
MKFRYNLPFIDHGSNPEAYAAPAELGSAVGLCRKEDCHE